MAKKKTKGWRYKGDRFTEKKWNKYALAIGQTALAWNDLYEALAMLFATLQGGGWVHKHYAIWHSQTMDRAKRELLKGAIAYLTQDEEARFPRMAEAVKWIADTTEKLEDARNNTIHLPLFFVSNTGLGAAARAMGMPEVLPQMVQGHPRALRMAEKDLLAEFRWCRQSILVVRDFTRHLGRALSASHAPWPDIPKLPDRPAQTSPQGPRRQGASKPRARQRPASGG
jgi:hypothetical protein